MPLPPARDLTYELNRKAATLVNARPTLSAQAAANVWLGAGSNFDLVSALNRKAGITTPNQFKGLDAICNQLAGTTNLSPAGAISTIA
jgi:hypothetical protein